MKRFFIVITISIVSQVAVAQWRYTLTISSGSTPTVINCGPYSTKVECEQHRQLDIAANTWSNSIGGDGWGGMISVKATATPCSGPASSTIGNLDVLGVDKGNSFYSTNGANDIRDWANDDMEKILALNPEYSPKEPKTVATGDISFDNIIESMPYSDEAFSGRMPRGTTKYIKPDNDIVAIGHPVRGNGILVPDDFTSKPFDYGLGVWSSDDLNPLNVDLKPVPNGIKTFDEEGWDLWRDGLRLGKDMGMFVYGLGEGVAASTVAVASFLGDANINLWTELYKAKSKIDLDEAYEAPDNILTEAAVYWGGKEYAIVGNVLYNALNSTVNDFVNLVSDVTKEKTIDEVKNKALTKEGTKILSKAENYANIGTIALDGFNLGGKVADYYNKRK